MPMYEDASTQTCFGEVSNKETIDAENSKTEETTSAVDLKKMKQTIEETSTDDENTEFEESTNEEKTDTEDETADNEKPKLYYLGYGIDEETTQIMNIFCRTVMTTMWTKTSLVSWAQNFPTNEPQLAAHQMDGFESIST